MITIPEYLNRITNSFSGSSVMEYSSVVELEKLLLKIPLDDNGDFFVQPILFQKRADGSLLLNPKVVEQLTSGLGLLFITEKEKEGNVCLANSGELRPEFKQAFTTVELLAYHYALLHSLRYREANKALFSDTDIRILMPPNADFFWKLVQIGSNLFRKES